MILSSVALALMSVTPLTQVNQGYNYATRFIYQVDCPVVVGYSYNATVFQGYIRSTFYCQLDFNSLEDMVFYIYGLDTSVSFYDDQGLRYNQSYYRTDLHAVVNSLTEVDITPIFDFDYSEFLVNYTGASLPTPEFINTPFDDSYFSLDYEYEVYFSHVFNYDIPLSIRSDNAYTIGYNTGYEEGWTYARDEYYDEGYTTGYNEGYVDGYDAGGHGSGEASVIFGAILNVAMIPVNFFLAILNFEVFGINIGGFVTGLLTLAVIYILWKIILGHGGNL